MPRVNFPPTGKSVDVEVGTSLYEAARRAGLPVASSCSSEFICGKCNLTVVGGGDALSKQTAKERSLLAREGRPTTDRVSCRTAVFGDCSVTATYW